jgi:hypothetical protein
MNSDIEELIRATSYISASTASLEAIVQGTQTATASTDAGNLAVEVSRLLEVTKIAAETNAATVAPKSTKAAGTSSTNGEKSVVDTVLHTAEMATGVGPIVAGLMQLFGSKEQEALPPLEKFVAPGSVSVEAGLSSTREFGAIRYSQGSQPEMAGGHSTASMQSAAAPTINVNIQAMDSRSFLDRQDDIARAVREAMLHSNSLNDVVMDL